MAVLVDGMPAESKVPVDHADRSVQHEIVEPGLLAHLAPRRDGRGLGDLEVALGEAPVAIGAPDQEEARLAIGRATEDDPARTRFPLGAALAALHVNQCGVRSAECGVAGGVRPRTPALRLDGGASYSALRTPHSAFRSFRTPHSAFVC